MVFFKSCDRIDVCKTNCVLCYACNEMSCISVCSGYLNVPGIMCKSPKGIAFRSNLSNQRAPKLCATAKQWFITPHSYTLLVDKLVCIQHTGTSKRTLEVLWRN